MKKIFTLMVMALMAVGANAQEEFDISLDASKWTGGWNASASNEGDNLVITLSGDYGASGYLFGEPTDLSKYDKLCVVVEDYPGGWGQIIMKGSSLDGGEVTQTFGKTTSQKTYTLNFDNTKATAITEIDIQGATNNPSIKVSRVYFVEKLEYQEPQAIELEVINDGTEGNVESLAPTAALASFSDAAKVEITVAANIVTQEKYLGWGIGKFQSADASVQLGDFSLKQNGDNVYSFTIKELREAINAPENAAGKQGIDMVMWGQGRADGNTFAFKSFVVYEVKGATAINTVKANNATNTYFDLQGRRVAQPTKGLYVVNGKKVIVK